MSAQPTPTCCRCEAAATFDSPASFCDEHWARWWGGFDPEFPFEDGEGPDEELYQQAKPFRNYETREPK